MESLMNRKENSRKRVTIYTHGTCLNHGGPGGFCAILLHEDAEKTYQEEICHRHSITSRNRIGMISVIRPLLALTGHGLVTIKSNSQYLVNGIKLGNQLREDADLWGEFYSLCEKHEVTVELVEGRDSTKESQHCEQRAFMAAANPESDPALPLSWAGLRSAGNFER